MNAAFEVVPLVIGSALALGGVVLVASIAIGLFGFNPEAAQAIRDAEADAPVVVEEVRRVHVARPDRFRRGRLDRHPFYLGIHIAAFCYSICIFAGAEITSNLATLSPQTRFTMAACFLIGSTLVLSGATMGARVRKWTIVPGVRDNIASARLGDDIRLPYMFAAIGMFSMGISMGMYASTSFRSTTGSLGGWMTGVLSAACAVMLVVFYRRIRQYSRTRTVVVDQAVTNVILRGGHVAE